MPAPANLDWLFTTLGYTLAAAGAALLLWSLFYDRSRGRRRCPKCWYDVAGVPGLTCPECGKETRSESRLYRTRRRWRAAALAMSVAVAGYVALNARSLRAHGPIGLVPSTMLLLWNGQVDVSSTGSNQLIHGSPVGRTVFSEELYRRYLAKELHHWQQRLVSRALPVGRLDSNEFQGRDRWPEGVPLLLWGYAGSSEGCHPRRMVFTPLYAPDARTVEAVPRFATMSHQWMHYLSRRQFPPPPPGDTPQIAVELWEQGRGDGDSACSIKLWSTVLTLPVVVSGTPEGVLLPVETSEYAESLRLKLRRLRYGAGWAELEVSSAISPPENLSFGLRVEFLERGIAVAWVSLCLADGRDAFIEGDINRLASARQSDHDWTVRVRGDAAIALRARDATSYWKGEFTKPWSEIEISDR
jgi:hypothetical protein